LAGEVADLFDTFAGDVGRIHVSLESQKGTVGELEAAMGIVDESSQSTKESLTSLHDIVKELVSRADGLREDVEAYRSAPSTEESDDGVELPV
jgi:methyl-accepting chemotaxis protein